MAIVADERELPASRRVWGTGGWMPPTEREALDWLTLARLMGWEVAVARRGDPDLEKKLSCISRWLILACDPDSLSQEWMSLIADRLAAAPILVIARAGAAGGTLAQLAGTGRQIGSVTGKFLSWTVPESRRNWHCRQTLTANCLEVSPQTSVWATLDGIPLVTARRVGQGMVAVLGFHPSEGRDSDGAVTALLKHLLIWGALAPVAWLDLEGSLILRMDDPGGAQNVYLRHWSYPKLGESEWAQISAELKQRHARLTIGYVSGWVDDGDPQRGDLTLKGRSPQRLPGTVYPSPLVQYRDSAGHLPGTLHDYESEFRGIQALRLAGLGDVELHGYTHLYPDTTIWSQAADRYENPDWFRELGKMAAPILANLPPERHPLKLGIDALSQYFATFPTTLICPGDEWTEATLERALDLGIRLVSSYYLALRHQDRFCWATHVGAPYLNEPDAAWFDAGLPVVGYFHDLEPAVEGVSWLQQWLARWQEAGARKFIDFRELAGALDRRIRLEEGDGGMSLTVNSEGAVASVSPLAVNFRMPGSQVPSHLAVNIGGQNLSLPVERFERELGRVILPPSPVL
jgi:hypothetical protein